MDPTSLQAYASAPISRLPAETLLEIFDFVIEDCELIMEWYQQLTHVCQYWRQLAINTARLWTNIPVDSDLDNPHWTHTALERSKSAMLNINLWYTGWQTNIAVFKHIARIEGLDIANYFEGLAKIAFILSVVEDDPKELRWLSINNVIEIESEGRLSKLPESFSAATKLEHLDLRYTEIDWKSPLLVGQSLTWLTLHSSPLLGGAPSWEDLLAALSHMHRLSLLDLKHTLPLGLPQLKTPIVRLPQLKTLIITCDEPSKLRAFLSQVTFPPLGLLVLGCDQLQQSEDDYARIIQDVVRKVPSSFADDFLKLTIEGSVNGIILSCHSYCNNNLNAKSQRKISFAFACNSGSLFKAIVRDTLTVLRLHSTLLSLDIRRPIIISPEDFVDLFGAIAKLAAISILGGYGYYIAVALGISLYHPSAPIPAFPALETIKLIQVDFQESRNVEQLEDALIQRFENGVQIKTIRLARCPGLNSAIVKRFADIVVDVSWVENYG